MSNREFHWLYEGFSNVENTKNAKSFFKKIEFLQKSGNL